MISQTPPVCIILDSDNVFPFSAMLSQSMPSDSYSRDTTRLIHRIDAAIIRTIMRSRRKYQNDLFEVVWKSCLIIPKIAPSYDVVRKLFPQRVDSLIERRYIARETAKPDLLCLC